MRLSPFVWCSTCSYILTRSISLKAWLTRLEEILQVPIRAVNGLRLEELQASLLVCSLQVNYEVLVGIEIETEILDHHCLE